MTRALPFAPPHSTRTHGEAESGPMSTYGNFSAPIGSRRAPALRTVGTRERRSHLTAPRVPTVGIDIGGTKVMAGVVGAPGHNLGEGRTPSPPQTHRPHAVAETTAD